MMREKGCTQRRGGYFARSVVNGLGMSGACVYAPRIPSMTMQLLLGRFGPTKDDRAETREQRG
jgi:hypothetical protein